VNGYVLVVGNHISHLPLTSLRVIRGKSLLNIRVPPYATTTTITTTPTTTPNSYKYDEDGIWNVTKVYKDVDWKNISVDDQTNNWTTASYTDSQEDERLQCSLFVASNIKVNSTSIGLREIHLTSLHGQL